MNATLPGAFLRDFSRVLTCFSKVSDEVTFEAQPGKLLITAINTAKSSFLLATLNATVFDKFEYVAPPASAFHGHQKDRPLYCSLQIRALLSIFRSRAFDARPDANRDASVERCELKLLHPSEDKTQCAFLVRLVCKHGVRKTFKLQYEPVRSEHATCDRHTLFNRLKIPSVSLKEVVDHFAPRAEEVTLGLVDGNLQITSFTEGVVAKSNVQQILKQPVSTTVMMDAAELDEADADEDVRITFGLREFKACCVLSEQLGLQLRLAFETPGKPLLVECGSGGLTFELLVATTQDIPGGTLTARSGRSGTGRPPATLLGRKRPLTGTTAQRGRLYPDRPSSSGASGAGFSSMQGSGQRNAWTPGGTMHGDAQGLASQPLFLPEDEATQEASAGAQSRPVHQAAEQEGEGDFGFAESDNDALELYADEMEVEEDEAMSATQQPTQAAPKPRGLFD
ncbi:Rad9-domain-containing protein [Protomyces lactucae-debilis]|uniref:Rad9-domain-containing protein n=1 Tax=Protomyces lactucae-debilis TaxID=2754530 RepID=A0A1Y2FC85_PROLT|nr:Rad9-domain-containing protein [Protomyces lactucae-debilis]ORY81538.1 Rad9-domain-containing protein [Protomyces lactucae-debilis]